MAREVSDEPSAPRKSASVLLSIGKWGTVDKSLLLAAFLLPTYLAFWVLTVVFNADPHYREFFDQDNLPFGQKALLIASALWCVHIACALRVRRTRRDSVLLTHSAIQLWVVPNTVFGLAIGHMTSPWMPLMLIGGISVGLLLFGTKPTLVGLASFIVVYGGGWVAEQMGVIPYAWVLARPPFEGRQPSLLWEIGVGGGGLIGSTLMTLLIAAGIRHWRAQQLELERAHVDLAASHGLLEKRIAERTRELAEANAILSGEMEERQRLHAQLAHAQKMQAVGKLAGGIAHEFNNMLTVILGHSELLLKKLDPGDPLRKSPEVIAKTSERAGALVRQLLAYGSEQRMSKETTDLAELVQRNAPVIESVAGEEIKLKLSTAEGGTLAECDPFQIEQAMMSLVLNACDAMESGGTLSVSVAPVELTEELIAVPMAVPPGRYVRIEVGDTGHGIPPGNIEEIFTPFFTTKKVGHGTGMGLSVAYGIMQQNEGYITVDSVLDEGARFDLYLKALSN